MNKQRAGGRKDGYARTPGLTGILVIHVVMSMAHRLTYIKHIINHHTGKNSPTESLLQAVCWGVF